MIDTILDTVKDTLKTIDNVKDTKFYKELEKAAKNIGVKDLDKEQAKAKIKEIEKDIVKIALTAIEVLTTTDTKYDAEEGHKKYEELVKAYTYLRLFIL